MFFSFDGIDGAGKSTQMRRFCDWLKGLRRDVVVCRDPGSTPLGEKLRSLLLDHGEVGIGARSEMLLYMAARAQLVEDVIQPALAAGQVVVCDRFLLANVVYQGHAGGLDPEELWRIGKTATAGVAPRLTFLLDLSPSAAAARRQRPADRIEGRGEEYQAAVRRGFLAEAARRPQEILVFDGTKAVETIEAQIRAAAERVLT